MAITVFGNNSCSIDIAYFYNIIKTQKGKGYTTIKLKTNLNTVGTVNYQKS